ncbi:MULTISPECIES: DUF1127 domain-containing protein [Cedecea]|uniref:YjiS-like domain-containing protein n=1 Tax=Cedecea davisae DSM 4568 TaxID=566551 RepID=S3IKD6_9ENTR|nr:MULTISPECIES: DUF1127 domain-containing protein [Cedecea]EPF12866.1 hypothetical protein HMPREF0201_04469 [Cedecea davisae DSM 4568]QIX95949.1 DUF1127 domain-containing protein [Cedecea sp. FDAARGOS_727]SUX37276.1 Uncharacterized conserved small protein [Cedecea davisae]
MGFDENHHRRPFHGLVMLYQYFRRIRQRRQTVRALRELSTEQLRDMGLTRDDLSRWE